MEGVFSSHTISSIQSNRKITRSIIQPNTQHGYPYPEIYGAHIPSTLSSNQIHSKCGYTSSRERDIGQKADLFSQKEIEKPALKVHWNLLRASSTVKPCAMEIALANTQTWYHGSHANTQVFLRFTPSFPFYLACIRF
jgi:hypothetical protein